MTWWVVGPTLGFWAVVETSGEKNQSLKMTVGSRGAEKAGNKTIDIFARKSSYYRHLEPLQYAVVVLGGLYPTSCAPQQSEV
jgi:hypothetical protein